MAAVQAEDVRASFLFVGDLIDIIRSGWVLQPQIVLVLQSLFLDLLMTEVPDLVWVALVAPIGNSHRSSLSAVISMPQGVPNLCVSIGKFSLNIK